MQKYKGIVKFISNTGELALVEQTAIDMDNEVSSVIIGYNTSTGDLVIEGNVGPLVREGSVSITFGSSATVVGEDISLSTSTGLLNVAAVGSGTVTNGVVYTSTGTYDTSTGSYGWLKGSGMSTSKVDGFPHINYETGYVKVVADSSIGDANTPVKISYTRDVVDAYQQKTAMLRGSFTDIVVGDVIYYYYSSDYDYESKVTLQRLGQ
jgi:hypothetical protein